MYATIIPVNKAIASGPIPNDMRPGTFTTMEPKVTPMMENYRGLRTLARPMQDQIGMYSSTKFMSFPCQSVDRLRTVDPGQMNGLSFNQSDVAAQPPSWKTKGLFSASQRLGNLGSDLTQTRTIMVSTKSY
jgi:hypothetical protein